MWRKSLGINQGENIILSTLEITSENENRLLSRKELVCNFSLGSGLITRQGATDAIATRLGVKKESVKVISLTPKFGSRDLTARAYVYSDLSAMERQLPKYLETRQLSKEERKKAKEAKKAAATAPTAEKKA
jgi:ribosomal protein S24E